MSAYLGSLTTGGGDEAPSQLLVAFKNSGGQTISSVPIGPLNFPTTGMTLQQRIGLVPAGTARVTVPVSVTGLNGAYGTADSLSLVLTPLTTTPPLGYNLVVNPGGEL